MLHVEAFDDGAPVWRVEWNVTGTVLATSADDGVLRLRRRALTGAWDVVSTVDMGAAAAGESRVGGTRV